MAGSFLDLLQQGLGRVGQATDLTSGPSADVGDVLLQHVLAPLALARGVLQGAEGTARTAAGVITPSELSGQPDNPAQFAQDVAAKGLLQASIEAQQRFHAAPEAFPTQKGIVEFGLNPLNVVGAGLPRAALAVAPALRSTPAIGKALEAAAAAEGAFGQGVGKAIGAVGQGAGEAVRGIPGVGRLFEASGQARVAHASDTLANLQANLKATAGQLGMDIGPQGVTRAVFDPELRAAQAAEAAGVAPTVAKNWTQTANQDLDIVRNSLAPRAGLAAPKAGQPFDLSAARAALDAAAPADPAIVRDALRRVSEAGLPETSSNMLKAIDTALEAKYAGTGQVLEERARWSNLAAFLEQRYGSTLPGDAEAAVAARLAKGAPPAPAPSDPAALQTAYEAALTEAEQARRGLQIARAENAPAAEIADAVQRLKVANLQKDTLESAAWAQAHSPRPTNGAAPTSAAPPPEGVVPPTPEAAPPATPFPGAPVPPQTPAEAAARDLLAREPQPGAYPSLDAYQAAHAAWDREWMAQRATDVAPRSAPDLSAAPPSAAAEGAIPSAPPGVASTPLAAAPPPDVAAAVPASGQPLAGPLDRDLLLGLTPGSGAAADLRTVLPATFKALDADRAKAQAALSALGLEGQALPEAAKAAANIRIAGVQPKEAKALVALGQKYGGLDILAEGSDDAAVLANYVHQVAAGKGLGDTSTLGKTYHALLTGWRQQALFAPAYHVNNILDALFKSVIYLGHGGFTDLGPNIAAAYRHTFTGKAGGFGPATQAWLDARGVALPQEILQGGLSTELTGAASREPQALERLPGLAGKLFEFNRALGHAIETSARTAAFMHGYDQAIATTGGRLAELAKLPLADIAKLDDATRVAVTEARDGAYQAGIALADKLHFNYRDTSNLDQALRQVAGFHMFATRNLPLYAEILATHPGLYNALKQYDSATAAEQQAAGNTGSKRFENTIPLGGVGQAIAQTLFGSEGQIFFNPTRYLSITGQLFSTPPNEARDETGLGRALDVVSPLGVGLNPFAQAAANIGGVFGSRQPSSLLRLEPLLKAITEVVNPAGGVPQTPWEQVQRLRPFGGPTPSDPNSAVLRRLGQMSLEATGQPGAAEYVQAAREGPTNPLWQQAVRDIGGQGLVERPLSLLGLPVVTQRGGDVAINAAQAGIPQINAAGGGRPLQPIIPNSSAHPGDPLVTAAQRDALLAARAAAGQPAALGYQDFRPPPSAGPSESALSQRKDKVIAEYLNASPARRQAILADPTDRLFVWQYIVQHSPLFHQTSGGSAQLQPAR